MMSDTTPQNITLEEALQLAQSFCKQGRLQQSADICAQILRQQPDNVTALFIIAAIFRKNKQPAQALTYIDKALEINPAFADALHEKALLLAMTGQTQEAEKTCQQAIALNSDNYTYYNTQGHCLFKMGQAQEAGKAFDRALELSPENATILCNIAAIHSYISSPEQFKTYLNNLLAKNIFNQPEMRGHKADLLTSQALIAWTEGDKDHCRMLVQEASELLTGQEHYADYRYVNTYINWLQALLKHKMPKARDNLPLLYFVGDSHSIALAHAQTKWQGIKHKVHSLLIKGCKAWHLGGEQPNHYKLAFRRIMTEDIPKNKPVVFVFGEIDCRYGEGIFAHCKKHHMDVNTNIQHVVQSYIAFINEEARQAEITPVIWGVPAPLGMLVKQLPTEDREPFVQMIAEFNKALRAMATHHHMPFIDVHALTAGKDGMADGSQHLEDRLHLQPGLYQKALNNS